MKAKANRGTSATVSVIIPARSEATSLREILPRLKKTLPAAEIIVIDDGSVDDTRTVCEENGIIVISHPYGMGNGAAVKAGARAARGNSLVLMDGDGQHQPEEIPGLLKKLDEGYDMVVGARSFSSQAGLHRGLANFFYNRLASWIVGRPIPDLTSGFRAVKRNLFLRFLHLLPNGFSYPTTITMSFFRAGHPVAYLPIPAKSRVGRSHVRILRDGLRFLMIIFKIGTLYSPLKIFLPVSLFFFLAGAGHYLFTYLTRGRFTNMSALLFITSVLVFLIGLVSEQITSLNYKGTE